jgi:hypothetical protein
VIRSGPAWPISTGLTGREEAPDRGTDERPRGATEHEGDKPKPGGANEQGGESLTRSRDLPGILHRIANEVSHHDGETSQAADQAPDSSPTKGPGKNVCIRGTGSGRRLSVRGESSPSAGPGVRAGFGMQEFPKPQDWSATGLM